MENKAAKIIPWIVVGLCVVWVVSTLVRIPEDKPGELKVQSFAKLPVIYKGRVKPYDTLARNSLLVISERETFVDNTGEKQPAIKWLLDVISGSPKASQHRVFRIVNEQVLHEMGLRSPEKIQLDIQQQIQDVKDELKSGSLTQQVADDKIENLNKVSKIYGKQWKFRYALAEFEPKLEVLTQLSRTASQKDEKKRSVLDNQILELANQVQLYRKLQNAYLYPPSFTHTQLVGLIQTPKTTLQTFDETQRNQFIRFVSFIEELEKFEPPLSVPQKGIDEKTGKEAVIWTIYPKAFAGSISAGITGEGGVDNMILPMTKVLTGWRDRDQARFNEGVNELDDILYARVDKSTTQLNSEYAFNFVSPFYSGMFLYVIALLLSIVALVYRAAWLNLSAYRLLAFIFVFHTIAMIYRIYLSGYPPVTNLYSSAIFIGWGAVLFGLCIERLNRLGVGNLVASFIGFATLLIAHYLLLAEDRDTMEMMQAVLDTKFWLWTHVLTVTMGYTATFVAGLIGIVYVIGGLVTRFITKQVEKDMVRLMYGTLCFALFFSFVGTVLGGLWADDSWGRFWGWDPKENGALIIVLWNALILHARWGGIVRDKGIALLSIFGNVVTSWSWFGVNQLSVGLHSYGFTDSAMKMLGLFALSQMIIILIGASIPKSAWLSFQPQSDSPEDKVTRPKRNVPQPST